MSIAVFVGIFVSFLLINCETSASEELEATTFKRQPTNSTPIEDPFSPLAGRGAEAIGGDRP